MLDEPPAFGGEQEIVWGGLIPYTENNQTKYKLPDVALGDPAFELIAYLHLVFLSVLFQVTQQLRRLLGISFI